MVDGNEPSDDALGFDSSGAPKKDEKYNTRYLTTNLQKDRRNSFLMAGGIIGALVLGLVLWNALKDPEPPKAVAAPAAEAAPEAHAAKPEEAKPAEAKPAEAKAEAAAPTKK
jgi:hypothetical protein